MKILILIYKKQLQEYKLTQYSYLNFSFNGNYINRTLVRFKIY
jgi:hypothetical protein